MNHDWLKSGMTLRQVHFRDSGTVDNGQGTVSCKMPFYYGESSLREVADMKNVRLLQVRERGPFLLRELTVPLEFQAIWGRMF